MVSIRLSLWTEKVSGLSYMPMILVNWVLVVLPQTQLLLNMTGNLSKCVTKI